MKIDILGVLDIPASKVFALFVLVAALAGVFWWPGLRSSISLVDLAAALSVPFFLVAFVSGWIGRVFIASCALLLLLLPYWWIKSIDPTAFVIVTARMVEGPALFWLAVFCFSRLSVQTLASIVRIMIVSVVIGGLIWSAVGARGYYGFATLPFDEGAVHAGTAFALSAFWCLFFLDKEEAPDGNTKWAFLYGVLLALTVWTVSRVAIVALCFTLPYFLFRADRRVFIAALLGALLLSVLQVCVLAISAGSFDIFSKLAERAGRVGIGAGSRWEKWQPFLEQALSSWSTFLFGGGPGSANAIYSSSPVFFTADSQYVRSLFEFGVVGAIALHGILLLRAMIGFADRREVLLYLTFLGMCGTLFVTHEVLMVAKPMAMIFLVAGSLTGFALRKSLVERGQAPAPMRTRPN